MRKLLDSGHGWVKLSGAYLYGGGTPPHYAGASEAARGYLKAAPERCVWGSDWPHPDATKKLNPVAMPDDVVLLNLLARMGAGREAAPSHPGGESGTVLRL